MEEFRANLVESLVAYLINPNIFTPKEFTSPDKKLESIFSRIRSKSFLKHWEEKLQSDVTHLHTGYQVNFRRCLELQLREYVTCLMGDVDMYRPMSWKL
ncbi:MAG: CRISPR-associated endonuclease Cas1 [Rhizonema sp. PD38]|nr:CRISPR-associated endonuclease Cas1 [Rhizonema sp. PD38]